MQTLVIPALVLATVALSSSNVLPVQSMNGQNGEPLDYDNTNNKHHTKDLNAILLNVDFEPDFETHEYNMDPDNNDNSISKNYNVKGFRKEQWHNYPRQLDRLNRYFFDHSSDKRNLDPDDPGEAYADENAEIVADEEIAKGDASNELHPNNDPDIRNEAEVAAAVMNPLLIFRIHLACYNKDLEVLNQDQRQNTAYQDDNLLENNDEVLLERVNPESSLPKVKREGKMNSQSDETVQKSSKNRTMKKRIFSLWSRLQSLNHKGHELHHRRHLYALYGLPDSEGGGGGGVLTAETRATFMRPPGSPLRWG